MSGSEKPLMRDMLQAFMEGQTAPSAECCHALRPFILGVRARPYAQCDGCLQCYTSKQSMAAGVTVCGIPTSAAAMIQPAEHTFLCPPASRRFCQLNIH